MATHRNGFSSGKTILAIMIAFALTHVACSSGKSENKSEGAQPPQPLKPEKMSAPLPVKALPKRVTKSSISLPKAAIGWAWLPGESGVQFMKGWSAVNKGASAINPVGGLFVLLMLSPDGRISPTLLTRAQSPQNGGITIDGALFTPSRPLPAERGKPLRFNVSSPQALITFHKKRAAGLFTRWPLLKKVGPHKISVVVNKDQLAIMFRPHKKKLHKDFRNALTYWHQLALSARTSIHLMGGSGPDLSRALLKAKFTVKKKSIVYTIPASIEALGWALAQLHRLYPVDQEAAPAGKSPMGVK